VRFGRKLKIPSVIQIKHQLLLLWLKDQTAREAAEAGANDTELTTPTYVRDATL
jgi:hypothetical protein